MKNILLTVMKRFMKAAAVNKKTGMELLKIDVKKKENQMVDESVVVGSKSGRLLKKLSPYEEKREQAKMKEFFIVAICYLKKKRPLGDKLLISTGCFHSDNRKNECTVKNIEYLANCFPQVVEESEVSILTDDWKLYQVENEKNLTGQDERIYYYWQNVFKLKTLPGAHKYPLLAKLVKSVLSLHHGNSAVERSLSDNENTVTTDRTELLDETVISLRRMTEYARSKGSAHNIIVVKTKKGWRMNGIRRSFLNSKYVRQRKRKGKRGDAEKMLKNPWTRQSSHTKKKKKKMSWMMI